MSVREIFTAISNASAGLLDPGEQLLLWFEAESSDFVRFNANRVRQAGHVRQARATLTLVHDHRQAGASLDLSGTLDRDRPRLASVLARLRDQLGLLPADPFLHFSTRPVNTERIDAASLPDVHQAAACIHRAFRGTDLTGIWAAGETCAGFANSLGQRNWHSVSTFNFDWSIHRGGQGVKRRIAGQAFDADALAAQAEDARESLALLSRSPRRLPPGSFRAYLAPEAVAEILHLVSWEGFGMQSHRTRSTPFSRMVTGDRRLDERVSLSEDNAAGLAPGFTAEGFIKPDRVALIEKGGYADCLVGARSGREFQVPVNAAAESPRSLRMAPGRLPAADVLSALDTGIYISNLWYCNFSDRNDCRITGMTRFACHWVKNGVIRAPIAPMRFDDSLYRLLGDRLAALTAESTLVLDADTYGQRSTASMQVPGVLVDAITLTL